MDAVAEGMVMVPVAVTVDLRMVPLVMAPVAHVLVREGHQAQIEEGLRPPLVLAGCLMLRT